MKKVEPSQVLRLPRVIKLIKQSQNEIIPVSKMLKKGNRKVSPLYSLTLPVHFILGCSNSLTVKPVFCATEWSPHQPSFPCPFSCPGDTDHLICLRTEKQRFYCYCHTSLTFCPENVLPPLQGPTFPSEVDKPKRMRKPWTGGGRAQWISKHWFNDSGEQLWGWFPMALGQSPVEPGPQLFAAITI